MNNDLLATLFAVAVAWATGAAQAQQSSFVSQFGTGNRAATHQTGVGNDATTMQRGGFNDAAIRQSGTDNVAAVVQSGEGFTGQITQSGERQSETLFQVDTGGRLTESGRQSAGDALTSATVGYDIK